MASLGELFIKLGVKADTATVKRFDQGIKTVRTNLLGVQVAAAAAAVGVERFVNSALKGVVALQNLNAQTGLSIAELQKWQQAGQLSNLALNADQIANSIASVQKNLAQIRIGQGNLAPFQLLGIDVAGQDAFGVLEQLRSSIQGIDPAIATNLITQLGLSPDFINLLKLSRKEFDLLGENVFLSGKQRADIDKVGTSIKALTLRFKALKDQAVAKLAPSLNDLVQKFFKWLKDNGDKIVRTMTSIAKGFSTFAVAMGRAFDLTASFMQNIFGMENGIKALTVAFGFLTLSFSPFLAGLAAIVLILEDIAVFRKGGKSVIGDLVDTFQNLPDISKALFGVGGVVILSSLAKNMNLFSKSLKGLIGIATSLTPITAFLVAATAFANAPAIGEKVASIINETEGGKKAGDFLAQAKRDFTLSGTTAESSNLLTPYLSSLGALSYVINNNNNISVNGVQDTQTMGRGAGEAISNSATESLKRAQDQQCNIVK